ncbi:MAG TPA: hypothetical protein VF701_04535 [Thermoanaerobaculia bacterium]
MSLRIAPFIFSWKGQFEKACRTEDQLRELFDRVTVINSDEDNTRPGWIDVGDDLFFTGQFLRAVDHFDADVLFHIQADAHYDDWPAVFDRARESFERVQWGVFAPNVDFTGWVSPGVDIASQFFPADSNLRLVSCTDCTCWMIHRDVIEQFRKHRDLFSQNRYGWGIDLTIAALSYLNERPVVRDYAHTVIHPRGRGYDNDAARKEYDTFLDSVRADVRKVLEFQLTDRQRLVEMVRIPVHSEGCRPTPRE